MSAWLVSDNHINVLVEGAIRLGLIPASDATKTGRMLRRANTKSIRARYGYARYDTPETYDRPTYRYWTPRQSQSDASLLKQVHCYDYQTCEYDSYYRSPAYRMVQRLERALSHVNRETSEYDEAPWGV